MIGLYCDECKLGHTFKICLVPLEAICYNCKAVTKIPEVQLKTLTKVTLPPVNRVVPGKDNGYKIEDLESKEKEVLDYLKKNNLDYKSWEEFRGGIEGFVCGQGLPK